MLISLLETEVFRIQMFYTGQKTKGDIFQQLYFSSKVLHKVVIKHNDIPSSLNEEKNVRISSVSEVGNQCEILIVLWINRTWKTTWKQGVRQTRI